MAGAGWEWNDFPDPPMIMPIREGLPGMLVCAGRLPAVPLWRSGKGIVSLARHRVLGSSMSSNVEQPTGIL